MITRNTKQREEILSVICGANIHMTAEEVHQELHRQNKPVGIATVYRNLNRLAEENAIVKVQNAEGCYYDGNSIPHYHMRCTSCGRLQDVPMDYQEELNKIVQEKMKVQIFGHQLTFDCLCDDCLSKRKEKEKKDDKFKRNKN
ncbi:MAG: Fur family transcriptional regulator [Anaerorhabdus sp.]